MDNLSSLEKKAILDRRIKLLSYAVSKLENKSAELEDEIAEIKNGGHDFTSDQYEHVMFRLDKIEEEIVELNSFGKVRGADIYIQSNEPSDAKENDCWLDLSQLK